MDDNHPDQKAADPAMGPPPALSRKAGQEPTRQKRLNQQKRKGNNACEPGRYIDGITPCKQRACRRSGDRHGNGGRKRRPDEGLTGPGGPFEIHRGQAGCSTKSALRLVSLARAMTGRRKTVSKSSSS